MMKIRAKHVVVTALVAAWAAAGYIAHPWAAGGLFMAMHKSNPLAVEESTWRDYWADYKDVPQERKKLQGAMGIALFAIFGVPALVILARSGTRRSLHGDARWATHSEVEAAQLFAETGLILGKLGNKYLMMDEPKFVYLCAPTRSGKGVGMVIPNLLNFADSCIVVDIKGENWEVTSGFRASKGQEVYKFAPFGEEKADGVTVFESHRLNPLSYVNRDPRFVVGELQGLGYMLYPKKDGPDGFWNDQARNLLVGLALYCIECGYPVTLGEVLRRSNGGGKPKEFWQKVVNDGVSPDNKQLSEDCLNHLRQFVSNSDNTLTSILSTFNAPLGIFSNPSVDTATSGDDFDLRQVRRRRMSIYVVIPAKRLSEAALLVNLFFSLAIDQNTGTMPEDDPSLKYKCLLVLDEFPALGRVDKYVKSIGYIAGYGLRVLTISQSQSQLKDRELYGDEGTNTLVTNHLIQILYAPRVQHDANEYSEILGYATEKGVSTGVSRGTGSPTRSENTSDQKRALMLPQELRQMGMERAIVLADNCLPIFADKIFYYKDPAFMSRLLPAHKAPVLDVDGHVARRENRVRPALPGEVVKPGRLVLDVGREPVVTNQLHPQQQEVEAMGSWLFANVKWVQAAEAGAATSAAPQQEEKEIVHEH